MSAEIKTVHVFRCFCGKEATQEVINCLDRAAMIPMLPFGWREVGKYMVCPDEVQAFHHYEGRQAYVV